MLPDESLFRAHLEEAFFRVGVVKSKWDLHGQINWPTAIFWCKAATGQSEMEKIFLRFDFSGYPNAAPTACPWDIVKNQRLDPALWPKGRPAVDKVFNAGWRADALYAPCDRIAMNGHEPWRDQHKAYWWTPESNLVTYLTFIFELLNKGAE